MKAFSHADAAWQTGIPAMLVLVSVAWSEPLFPQGGPPLRTDDPGTPGDGNWEVNLAATAEKRDSRLLLEAPLADINYGVGERIQLKFEIPWLFLDEEDGPSKNGLGNSQVGVKWRFLDQAEEWLDVSVYPQVEFNNPSSSARRGLVDEGTAWTLPIELEKSFGPVSVNPEIGYVLLEDEDEWLYGLALGYSPSSGIELLAELHGSAESDFEDDELIVQAGLRWSVHPNLAVLSAIGHGIRDTGSDELEMSAYVGVQILFDMNIADERMPTGQSNEDMQ